jgi:hypothetical protein
MNARGSRHRLLGGVAVLLLGSCSGPADPNPPPAPPPGPATFQLNVVGGDHQRGPADRELPVLVRVAARLGVSAVSSKGLVWEVIEGDPVVVTSTPTDVDGIATARIRLGRAGPQSVRASADGDTVTLSFEAIPAGTAPLLLRQIPIPPEYGIHDTFVRAGIAFVCAWNTGVIIYDVGDGRRGGSPSNPVEISRLITADGGVPGGPAVHNAWWFHNPVTGERRYLFVGQEGPALSFTETSGDLHVVDVANLAAPREVATLRLPGAGVHNFWMDEPRQILYAAFYNAGVVALDVSGTLSGDLTSRIIARAEPGGPGNTSVWGVILANGALWASDIVSGFWKLDPSSLKTLGGGNNVPDRWGADLWIHGVTGYTGTWGGAPRNRVGFGDAIKIWDLSGPGPVLADSIIIPQISTVSDVTVTPDGRWLVATAEGRQAGGIYRFDLADPRKPVAAGFNAVFEGLHTGTVATIGGRGYVFAAKNPPEPALHVYELAP